MHSLLLREKANDFPWCQRHEMGCNRGKAFTFETSDQDGDLDGTIQ